ncbi:MAG: galactose oxidase-like domain-containing protein, partial [Anaeromyxobacteraceae bacterium]
MSFAIAAYAAAAQALDDPALVGRWSPVEPWPSATHVHLLRSGEVLFFGEFAAGPDAYVWGPASDELTAMPAPGFNIFCGGHSFLADGRLLVAGGHADSHIGLPLATVFDPFARSWLPTPPMNDRRWYPSNTTLANGDVVVVAGEIDAASVNNALPQVYEVAANRWRDLSSALQSLPYYPRQFLAPNGKVFVAGPQPTSQYLDTSGTGAWSAVASPNHPGRDYGPAVMYAEGKVMMIGGDAPPLASAEVIDLGAAAPAWREVAPMSARRRQHNATLLPDGRVFVNGGSSGSLFSDETAPVLHSETWDPATNRWETWASESVFRGYHSATLLLPDGRLLSTGGRGALYYSRQIFSPPYLFRGAQPVIASAPEAVDLAQPFTVETPDAGSVRRVTLLRNGSVTHSFNMEQRFLELSFTASAGGLTVVAPRNNRIAPPGHYLLFLLDAGGVPSVGHSLRIGTRRFDGTIVEPPPPDGPPPNLGADPPTPDPQPPAPASHAGHDQ